MGRCFYDETLREAADCLNTYVERENELIKLAGFNLQILIDKLKAGYTIEAPKEENLTPPPLGVMPRNIWNRKRQKGLADAMQRYLEAGKSIPKEWVDEYNELSDGEE